MNKNQLKKQIFQKELQLKQLQLHITSSDVCNQLYNKLVLEKAILRNELENLEENQIIKKVKGIFKPKEKLICDYWKK